MKTGYNAAAALSTPTSMLTLAYVAIHSRGIIWRQSLSISSALSSQARAGGRIVSRPTKTTIVGAADKVRPNKILWFIVKR